MAKEIKTYKRSDERPLVITEDHKKCLNGFNTTRSIIKYAIVAIILLTIIFNLLALVKVEVKDEKLDTFAKGKEAFANITIFELFTGWFDKANYTYTDPNNSNNNVNIGYDYPTVFSYIVGRVPALQSVIGTAGGMIFGSISDKQSSMLNSAYFAMMIFEVIILVSLLAMAVIFVLSLIKKINLSGTYANVMVIVNFVLQFILFAMTLALVSNSTKQFSFEIGIGMWLNMLVATIALGFVIANMIYRAKVKMYEEQAD